MISEIDLMWWCCLHYKCKALTEIKSVCDLGLQQLICVDQGHFEKATRMFAQLCGEPDVNLAGCGSSAEMWRRLRREIVSLDVIGNDISLVHFDLNKHRVPANLKEHFDFVTNVGTTEHVFNQANCIEVMHDLTKVGGIMAYAVPFAGYETHGFFRYTQKFFTRLSKVNDYDCLDAWLSVESDVRKFKPELAEFILDHAGNFRNARFSEDHPMDFFLNDYRSADGCIYVFLKKTRSMQFQTPLDLDDDYADSRSGGPVGRAKPEVASPTSSAKSEAASPTSSAHPALTDGEQATLNRLLGGTARLNEGLQLYHRVVARAKSFPPEWEAALIRLALAQEPGRPELVERLSLIQTALPEKVSVSGGATTEVAACPDPEPVISIGVAAAPPAENLPISASIRELEVRLKAERDAFEGRTGILESMVEANRRACIATAAALEREQALRAKAEAELDAIRASSSWRFTAPVRAVVDFFKKP